MKFYVYAWSWSLGLGFGSAANPDLLPFPRSESVLLRRPDSRIDRPRFKSQPHPLLAV